MTPTFAWDELSNEVTEGPSQNDEGWTNPTDYDNGVKLFLSDRNHVGLEVQAATMADAVEAFCVDPTFTEYLIDRLEANDAASPGFDEFSIVTLPVQS